MKQEEPLPDLQKKTGKILRIWDFFKKEVIGIVFETTSGDVFYGGVGPKFKDINDLKADDNVYLEFYTYSDLSQVDFEVIRKI